MMEPHNGISFKSVLEMMQMKEEQHPIFSFIKKMVVFHRDQMLHKKIISNDV